MFLMRAFGSAVADPLANEDASDASVGALFYDPRNDDKRYALANPVLDWEFGKSGSLTFTMYPGHIDYDTISEYKTAVSVLYIQPSTDDTEIELWRGRVISVELNKVTASKMITCEGILGLLNDKPYVSYQEKQLQTPQYTIKPSEALVHPISYYNTYIEREHPLLDDPIYKKFHYNIDSTHRINLDTEPKLSYEELDYCGNAWSYVDQLCENYGGHVQFSYDAGNDIYDLVYTNTDFGDGGQYIKLGKNLIESIDKNTINSDSMYSRLQVYGPVIDIFDFKTEDLVDGEAINTISGKPYENAHYCRTEKISVNNWLWIPAFNYTYVVYGYDGDVLLGAIGDGVFDTIDGVPKTGFQTDARYVDPTHKYYDGGGNEHYISSIIIVWYKYTSTIDQISPQEHLPIYRLTPTSAGLLYIPTAPQYNSSTTYYKGQWCYRMEGEIKAYYTCLQTTTGTFDPTKWRRTPIPYPSGLYNKSVEERYGQIYKVVTYDDIKNRDELLAAGQELMRIDRANNESMSLKAIDLGYYDNAFTPFKPGYTYVLKDQNRELNLTWVQGKIDHSTGVENSGDSYGIRTIGIDVDPDSAFVTTCRLGQYLSVYKLYMFEYNDIDGYLGYKQFDMTSAEKPVAIREETTYVSFSLEGTNTAISLSEFGNTVDIFYVGRKYLCNHISLKLSEPQNSDFSFGVEYNTLTKQQSRLTDSLKDLAVKNARDKSKENRGLVNASEMNRVWLAINNLQT